MNTGKKIAALLVFACSFFAVTLQTKAVEVEDGEVSVTCAKSSQVCYRIVKFGITKNVDGLAQIRL
jgi:hypothetical protein